MGHRPDSAPSHAASRIAAPARGRPSRAARFAVGLAFAAALTGCGAPEPGSPAPTDRPAELERVVYAGSKWYGHAATWVGIQKGIFAKHGFEVENTPFGQSSARVDALETGAAQFASLGEVAMLTAMSNDRKGFYWIGNQDIAPGNEGLVAIGIDTIEGLRGKAIALNGTSSVHITTALLLHDAGLDINTDVEIIQAPDSAVIDLVRSGEAQAGCIWEPFYGELQKLPGAKVLATDMDTSIYKTFRTMTGPDVICASRAWYDEDPARAKRLFRAYWEAVEWCRDNPEELLDIIAEEVSRERSVVAATMKNFQWLGWEEQKAVMSDAIIFGQAEAASRALLDMKLIAKEPAFRDWTRPDVFE